MGFVTRERNLASALESAALRFLQTHVALNTHARFSGSNYLSNLYIKNLERLKFSDGAMFDKMKLLFLFTS